MDNKVQLALSIINFLKIEASSGRLGEEGTEGLEVAIQCLETAYGVSESDKSPVNLLEIFNDAVKRQTPSTKPKTTVPSEADKEKAERLKNEGNELMKAERYADAIDCYTKAINIDPENAVYYCNRAAAYTKVNNSKNAIDDCQNAISIDAKYGKAYARLGYHLPTQMFDKFYEDYFYFRFVYLNDKNYEKAQECYEKAVSLEPTNSSYKSNLDIARENLKTQKPSAPSSASASSQQNPLGGLDLSSLLSNPAVMNMAQSFMQNPQMQNMFANMMGNAAPPQTGGEGEQGASAAAPGGFNLPPGMDLGNVMNATQQFAEQMRQENPDLVENLRSQYQQGPQPPKDNDEKSDGTS